MARGDWRKMLFGLLIFILSIISFILFSLRPKSVMLFLVALIILLPKINMIQIPGSYIAIRSEDFIFILIAMAVVLYALMNRLFLLVPKLIAPVFLYILATFFSLMASMYQGTVDNTLLAFLFFLRRIEYFVPFLLAYWILDKDDIPAIKRVFIWTFIITAVIAVLQCFQLIGGFYLGEYMPFVGERIFSTFSGPYEYAFYLALLFSYWVVEYYQKNRGQILLLLSSSYYLMMLTASRVTIASVVIGSIIAAFLERKARPLLLLLLILSVISFLYAPNVAQNRFSMLFSAKNIPFLGGMIEDRAYDQSVVQNLEGAGTTDIDISAVHRVIKWNNVLSNFTEYPLFGMGPAAFGEAVDGNYVRILGENGIVGFLAFAWLMYNVLAASYGAYRSKISNALTKEVSMFVLIASGIFLLNALFTDVFEASKFAFVYWLLIGVFCRVQTASGA